MDYEYYICQKKGVKVYKLPPMQTNQGHYLDSWKREDKLSEVNLKVLAKGNKLIIELRNPDETLFAQAPLGDNVQQSLVKCTDSSRGYALKLVDPKGKSVWVGISFGERNDSFDFHTSIDDFNEKKEIEADPSKVSKESESSKDWGLKKGEKITLDVGNKKNDNKSGGGGGFKLKDPNSLKDPNTGITGSSNSGGFSSNNTNKSSDPFDFSNFGSSLNSNSQQQKTTQNTQKSNNLFDDFSDFSSFGSKPQQQQQQQQQKKQDTKVDNVDFFDFGGNSGSSNTNNFGNQNKQNSNDMNLWDMGNSNTSSNKPPQQQQQQQQQKINYQNVNLLD